MTIEAAPDAECAECNHSPAYHDGQDGRPCRAWNPDTKDSKCACKGWKPKPPPAPAPPPPDSRVDLDPDDPW